MKIEIFSILILVIIAYPIVNSECETNYYQRGVLTQEKITLKDIPPNNGPIRIWLPYPQSKKEQIIEDFKTADGKSIYDLDFWMKKNHHGELEIYKVVIHKKDGKERFTSKDDEMVPVESKKMAPEEHT